MTDKYVCYYRVSTKKQGASGLGLEAQKTAVTNFVSSIDGQVVTPDYVEVESGASKERISIDQNLTLDSLLAKRPVLRDAIRRAQKEDAILVAKEISRFSRFTLLIDYLISTGVKFVCADYPNDSEMLLKFRATIAEDEAKKISQRTKQALAEKRKTDGEWRVSNLSDSGRQKSIETRKVKAELGRVKVANYVRLMRQDGMSYRAIASQLHDEGFKTPRNKKYSAMAVKRILEA